MASPDNGIAAGPREQHWLVGHEDAERTLLHDAVGARLHHAWLFAGPPGIGKATLAFRFARWLLAGRDGGSLAVDPAAPAVRRIAAGTHADLLAIGRGYDEKRQRARAEIVVDEVRPIADFLRRTAAEGGLARGHPRRGRADEPKRRQRAAEDPGGAAAATRC